MAAGRNDPSVYRYTVADIDHPDARLIAAAPILLEQRGQLRQAVEQAVRMLEAGAIPEHVAEMLADAHNAPAEPFIPQTDDEDDQP